jgi:hypothetical protein
MKWGLGIRNNEDGPAYKIGVTEIFCVPYGFDVMSWRRKNLGLVCVWDVCG